MQESRDSTPYQGMGERERRMPQIKREECRVQNTGSLKEESDGEYEESDEEDEELALYAKNIWKFKLMMQKRKRDMKKGSRDDYQKTSNYKKKNDEICCNCGKSGHYAKGCRSSSSKSSFDWHKKKEVLVATWSDNEDVKSIGKEEVNLALMGKKLYSSEEEESEVNAPIYDELINAFDELNETLMMYSSSIKLWKRKTSFYRLKTTIC